MMGLSNCMMEPSNPLKKIIKFTSLSRTTLRRKLVKSCLKSQVFSEVAYSQDRRWFRQQDARHTENKAGRDGLSVGTISHFLAGRYPSSRFWIFNFEPHDIWKKPDPILILHNPNLLCNDQSVLKMGFKSDK